ncbi:MAG: hypothetical protein K0S04_4232 [Herbinix sp.]|nr:hypothetical protein [Herbinix sp.]
MSAIKLGFSDAELFSYGIQAGYTLNEASCLFDQEMQTDCRGLQELISQNPMHKARVDYLIKCFMNPGIGLKVIGIMGQEFLGFRAALPNTNSKESSYAILFSAGDRGLFMEESRDYMKQVLLELSGFLQQEEKQPISFPMTPIDVLVIIAACDLTQNGRHGGGCFTKSALLSAYNNDNRYHPICSSLTAIAEEVINRFYTEEKVEEVLKRMVENKLIHSNELENGTVYCLSPQYSALPALFESAKMKLSMLRCYPDGNANIIFIISNEQESWAFSLTSNEGIIERLNEKRRMELIG